VLALALVAVASGARIPPTSAIAIAIESLRTTEMDVINTIILLSGRKISRNSSI
jgi:hypothetical protein